MKDIPEKFLRKEMPDLPDLNEGEVVRHFMHLAQKNFAGDTNFYPLGSCTMKYNPKSSEEISRLPGFARINPYQSEDTTQGIMELLCQMEHLLCEICGMDAFTLQPAAGAQGELTGALIAKAYHQSLGRPRKRVIIPDSAHGTNPASATIGGYEAVEVKSNRAGCVDLNALKEIMNEDVALVMITNPNTLGLFEKDILEIARIVHDAGALLYLDGANLNALLGICRPGDMGFDILHLNLHKTFGAPHGGGGPGSGPVGVKKGLIPFLPVPLIKEENGKFSWDYSRPHSIGKLHSFYGNIGVIIKAYCYLRMLGKEGLRKVSENAIINANYLRVKLREHYRVPYDKTCMHEFVISAERRKELGVRALDIAKRLLDFGFHAPTVYFPLIVNEAIMIEPTETESKETLDGFIEAMSKIAREAEETPEILKKAPHSMPVKRVDEVRAARELRVRK